MNCPRCQTILVNKQYEGVSLDTCSSCQGTWLDEGELKVIIEKREYFFKDQEIKKTLSERTFTLKESENESRIPCPKCMKMMKTFNYGGDSGIILDRCNDNHGLWFDQGELDKVQMFREHWEKEAQSRGNEWMLMINSTKTKSPSSLSPFQLLVNFFFD